MPVVGECLHLKRDVGSFHENNKFGASFQLELSFAEDIAASEQPTSIKAKEFTIAHAIPPPHAADRPGDWADGVGRQLLGIAVTREMAHPSGKNHLPPGEYAWLPLGADGARRFS